MTTTANEKAAKLQGGRRLEVLDGMRGVAATSVLFHHLMVRFAPPHWPVAIYPYGETFAPLFFLGYAGKFGVLSFFLISGFVILMTLERSSGLLDFASRRIARLVPAMLFCATASTLFLNLSDFPLQDETTEFMKVTTFEYIFSILFIPPSLAAQMLGRPEAQWVEGVYWTLWAEVRFYALAGMVMLLTPKPKLAWVWAGVQGFSTIIKLMQINDLGPDGLMWRISLLVQPNFLCWFTFGMAAYWAWTGRWSLPVVVSTGFALVALLAGDVIGGGAAPIENILLFAAIFAFCSIIFMDHPYLKVLTWKPVLAVGLASYPLYLFHESVGLVILYELEQLGVPPLLTLPLALVFLFGAALGIHKYVENPGKRLIVGLFKPMAARGQTLVPALRF